MCVWGGGGVGGVTQGLAGGGGLWPIQYIHVKRGPVEWRQSTQRQTEKLKLHL